VVGKRNPKKHKNWFSDEKLRLLKQRNCATKSFKRASSETSKQLSDELNEKLKESYEKDGITFIEDKIHHLKRAA
jgi:hypothetical protein